MDQTSDILALNIARYRALLANEADEQKREMLGRLLGECEAELRHPKGRTPSSIPPSSDTAEHAEAEPHAERTGSAG